MGGQFRIEKEKFNMSIKVGINGFGRIGRMVFRASLNHRRDRDRGSQRSVPRRLPGLHAEV